MLDCRIFQGLLLLQTFAAVGCLADEDDANALLNLGRVESQFPSPRCCHNSDCLTKRSGRNAFVTSLRSDKYLILLQELHCSLRKAHNTADLVVISVEGDLSADSILAIKDIANLTLLPEYTFPNSYSERFSKNWFKLLVWGFEEYDSIIMLDADGVVLGALEHIFDLPTDFAWTFEQGIDWPWNFGSFIMLRPCKMVLRHMMDLLATHPVLHFEDTAAEQSFLRFYFAHTGMRLPSLYSANWEKYQSTGEMAPGGGTALFLHFGNEQKPFQLNHDAREWKYMCHRRHKHALAV